jgi:hypothetical protein
MKRLMSVLVLTSASLSGLVIADDDPFTASATPGSTAVWRINEVTGEVSLCENQGMSTPAVCNPSSKAEAKGSYGLVPTDNVTTAWRINRQTGAVSLCEYGDTEKPPKCSPFN